MAYMIAGVVKKSYLNLERGVGLKLENLPYTNALSIRLL